MLKRFMIEKYFNENINDKKLIFIKFNLIYWSEYELFDVFQLTTSRFICILRFTRWTASMSNSTRIWVILMSWNEYHEMRLFVNRSIKLSCWDLLLISWFARWESEHDRWINEFDWSKISRDYRASFAWSERGDVVTRCDVLVLETRA